ncbi:hypothetical protein [Candidatus Albibeggiatoa sp. nov. BB20]|uniref:hypothetical protein n=1 Tax=Candidatus Albibeggiatoa sp. nov. BB20 TaxID=3162723 RepID=UPI0033659A32
MIFRCQKHGLAPPAEICVHFYKALINKEIPSNFHINIVHLRNIIRDKDYTGEFCICDDCFKMLNFEPEVIYGYKELSDETKQKIQKIQNFFCGDCVDEWMEQHNKS